MNLDQMSTDICSNRFKCVSMNKNNISANYYNTDETLFIKEWCSEMK